MRPVFLIIFFAVLCSMGICMASLTNLAYSYEIELEAITISLKEFENLLSSSNDTVISNPGGEHAVSVEALLDQVTGIDISKRGIFNIQSDMSIRGSTFEQASVAVNNIILNDPQTGHHNLDLAVPQSAIERIDIARGQSSHIWAQSSMGGAVNISTKKPVETELTACFLYGSDNTRKASVYASSAGPEKGINIAAEESSSDGFRQGTDFRQFSVSSSGLLKTGDKISNYIFIGYGEKEFAAAGFYAPYNSREWTDTLFLNWKADINLGRLNIAPSLYYRKHHDKFMLDAARPDFYLNRHKTGIKGALVESYMDFDFYGLIQAAIDINEQSIKSTKLGKDNRNRYSYSLTWKNHTPLSFGYDISLRVDDYSAYKTQILPQAGAYFKLTDGIRLRSSISKSARPPNYTELFYEDPANKGNRKLDPESAINYEAGTDFIFGRAGKYRLSVTAFMRNSDNLIDWIKYSEADVVYQAKNIAKTRTEGLEADFSIDIERWLKIKTGYSYIDLDIKKTEHYISKYALNRPGQKVFTQLDIILPAGRQSINLMYKNKKNYNSYFLLGCHLRYDLGKHAGLLLTVENIFNSKYWDIEGNTLPGRQILAGVKAEF
jgi:vitamin B12 transporter